MRVAIAERADISISEAGRLIGAIDCVIHEDITGVLMVIPNWLHANLPHKGYVAVMVKKLTGEDIKEDEIPLPY